MNVSRETFCILLMNVSRETFCILLMNVSRETFCILLMNVSRETERWYIIHRLVFNQNRLYQVGAKMVADLLVIIDCPESKLTRLPNLNTANSIL